MPRKKKTPVVTPAIDLPKEFLEKLIPGPMDAAGVEAVFQQLKKAVIERALGAELGLHPADAEGGSGNHRNGRSGKTVLTDEGPLRIDVPRDRTGTFEPQLIPKHERRFAGFDDRIVSMYARGMTVREIQGAPGRDVQRRGVAGVHQQGHRRGDGRGHRMAGRGRWKRCIRWCSSTRCG